MTHLEMALVDLDEQIAKLQSVRSGLVAVMGGMSGAPAKGRKGPAPTVLLTGRRTMSEESKTRIREAQQRRWAAVREGQAAAAVAPPVEAPTESAPAQAEPTTSESEKPGQTSSTKNKSPAKKKAAGAGKKK